MSIDQLRSKTAGDKHLAHHKLEHWHELSRELAISSLPSAMKLTPPGSRAVFQLITRIAPNGSVESTKLAGPLTEKQIAELTAQNSVLACQLKDTGSIAIVMAVYIRGESKTLTSSVTFLNARGTAGATAKQGTERAPATQAQ